MFLEGKRAKVWLVFKSSVKFVSVLPLILSLLFKQYIKLDFYLEGIHG